jgi:hypothetical protein
MHVSERTTPLVILINAATGAQVGAPVAIGYSVAAVLEVSGTYTNLEALFEISIDGGLRYWPVAVEPLSTGTSAPKMTTPGLYRLLEGFRAVTHMRAEVTASGTPTGAMTIKAVGLLY